eukprot:COSAG02_NODE_2186_length_9573_cov_5.783091_2_plen_135_part_00
MTAVKASAAKMKTIHHEMSGVGAQETTFSTPIPQPPSAADRVGAETVGTRRSFFEGEWLHTWSTGHTANVTIDLSEASTGAPRHLLKLGAPCSTSVVRRLTRAVCFAPDGPSVTQTMSACGKCPTTCGTRWTAD